MVRPEEILGSIHHMSPNDTHSVAGDAQPEPNRPPRIDSNPADSNSSAEAGVMRRATAKMIDFVAVGFTVVGFSSITHSYPIGLLIGYGWLLISDWGEVSLGKRLTGLKVCDHQTGANCTLLASVVRNLPFVAATLPHKLHQAWLGLDRRAYHEQYPGIVIAMAAVAMIVLLSVVIGAVNSPDRRHFGDRLAGTRVYRRPGPTVRPTGNRS